MLTSAAAVRVPMKVYARSGAAAGIRAGAAEATAAQTVKITLTSAILTRAKTRENVLIVLTATRANVLLDGRASTATPKRRSATQTKNKCAALTQSATSRMAKRIASASQASRLQIEGSHARTSTTAW